MSRRLNLTFVPVTEPRLIPRHLLEQIKNRDWSVDKWYQLQEAMKGEMTNLLFAAVDDEYKIRGFLWMIFDPFTETLVVNNFSLERAYQGGGVPMRFVRGFVRKIMKDLSVTKTVWLTDKPGVFERYGFKRSKNVLMELKE